MKELPVNKPELRALHARIGDSKVGEILQDFYRRMAGDILIGFFFEGRDLTAIAAKQQAFLLKAMGGQAAYQGKPPARSHDELAPILAGHFDRRLRILETTLRDHGLSPTEIETWIALENAFRDSVTA